MRRSHLLLQQQFTAYQKCRTRSGPQSAQALGLRFVYDATRKTRAVERVHLNLTFGERFSQLQGDLQFEEMACTEVTPQLPFSVPVCPNPAAAPSEGVRGPAPFTAVRVPPESPQN